MDKLHSRLKDLILFINANSQFDIFAVEVEYYKHEDFEIMIPKLFGEEVKGPDSGTRNKWTEQKVLDEASKEIGDTKAFSLLQSLLEFSKQHASVVDWGTGKESGSFTFKVDHPKSDSGRISLFTVWTGGTIRFRFRNISNHAGVEIAKVFLRKLSSMAVAKNWKTTEVLEQTPGGKLGEIFSDKNALETFKTAVLEFIADSTKPGS